MIRFSKEKVLLLHELIAKETGGDAGVRDFGLLESALNLLIKHLTEKNCFNQKKRKQQNSAFR